MSSFGLRRAPLPFAALRGFGGGGLRGGFLGGGLGRGGLGGGLRGGRSRLGRGGLLALAGRGRLLRGRRLLGRLPGGRGRLRPAAAAALSDARSPDGVPPRRRRATAASRRAYVRTALSFRSRGGVASTRGRGGVATARAALVWSSRERRCGVDARPRRRRDARTFERPSSKAVQRASRLRVRRRRRDAAGLALAAAAFGVGFDSRLAGFSRASSSAEPMAIGSS